MAEVIGVRFKQVGKVYYFDPDGITAQKGDYVIVETARGIECGEVAMENRQVSDENIVKPLKKVIRSATPEDLAQVKKNQEKQHSAFKICSEKIAQHKLDMKLVDVEYSFDNSKIMFYFTADGRVDFRDLVKDLAGVFRTRIELRQIGVRDEAKMLGGIGICGRPFCCNSFLGGFQPVSIKMAKEQGLSLNPVKISGTCGRLMCCLKYEQEAYEDLIRTSPKMDSFVDTPEGRGTVVEVDLLRQRVKVRMEDAPEQISVFPNTDIAILRNGKAKKNDPPIPADLAPISGSGKRVRREPEEEKLLLEPIRFKYSTERIVEEPEEEIPVAEQSAETAQPQKPSRSRRRRGKGQDEQKADQEKTEVQPKSEPKPKEKREPRQPKPTREHREPKEQKEPKEASEAKENTADQAKKPHRRPNHRRHRKPKPQSEG